jgi:hypothetical protein
VLENINSHILEAGGISLDEERDKELGTDGSCL